MQEKMLAAVVYGKKDVRVEQVDIPEIADNEALVKIEYAAICPSDMRYYNGSKEVSAPKVLGHEAAGEIIKVGRGVKKLRIGDRVVVNSDYKCGTCCFCKRSMHNFCTDQRVSDGCFAQYKAVPESSLYLIPEKGDMLSSSCTEPLACVLNGSDRANIKMGSTVVIIGAGPIGLMHIQAAKIKGASRIIVFEPLELRRNKALELGATHAFNPEHANAVDELKRVNEGALADSVIVTVGIPAVMEQSVELAGYNGTLLYFAGVHPPQNIGIDPNAIHYRQITITGSSDYPLEFFDLALKLISEKKVLIEPIISDIFTIHQAKEAFENAVNRKSLKTVIKML